MTGGTLSPRIVHVTSEFRMNGTGITNLLADLVAAQLAGCHRVDLVCTSAEPALLADPAFAELTATVIGAGSGLRAVVSTVRRLRRVLRSYDAPVALHAHTARAVALIALARPTMLWRTVATVHNQFENSALLMLLCRRIACVSEANRQRMARLALGTSDRRLVTVLNGALSGYRLSRPLDEQLDAADVAHLAAMRDVPTILYVGGLNARKGIDLLLRRLPALRLLVPGVQLVVLGNRDNPAIEALAHQLHLDDTVVFRDYHPHPAAFMHAATVLAVPSRREPFGLVALEARQAGLPVVAADVDGLPEVLDHGRAGVLVPVDDDDEWIASLATVLTDADRRAELAACGKLDLERFEVARMADAYWALYDTVCAA